MILLALLIPAPLHATSPSAVAAAGALGEEADDGLDETIRRELALFRAAAISLSEAMRIAEGLHAGARTADVSFDGASDAPVYRVRTFRDDRVWEHAVDARTGDITGAEIAQTLNKLDTEDRSNFAALKAVRQPLSEAVRVAERTAPGKAISGGVMSTSGKLSFVIIVVNGADLKQVVLEPPRMRRP